MRKWVDPNDNFCVRPSCTSTTISPTDEQLSALGYAEIDVPDCDSKYWLKNGRVVTEMTSEEKSAVDAAEALAVVEAECSRQQAKSLKLKQAENAFLLYCESLFGDKTKRGFTELNAVVEQLSLTNPEQAIPLAVKLLAIDAEAKREGGLVWWDDCAWHEEIV